MPPNSPVAIAMVFVNNDGEIIGVYLQPLEPVGVLLKVAGCD
jgi:hypothetical protein